MSLERVLAVPLTTCGVATRAPYVRGRSHRLRGVARRLIRAQNLREARGETQELRARSWGSLLFTGEQGLQRTGFEREPTVREPGIAILSDRSLFRERAVQLLRSQGLQRVTGYCSAAELLSALGEPPPRLVLVDMDHSSEEPYPLLRELRGRAPRSTVVLLGMARQAGTADREGQGAPGLPAEEAQVLSVVASLPQVSEEPPALPQPSIEAQLQRQEWSMLTPRQREVLGFLATGSDNLKIAAHLGISERAVKAHVSALLSLFRAENRTELAVIACRAGLRAPLRGVTEAAGLTRARTG